MIRIILLVSIAVFAPAAEAHHSFAATFTRDKTVQVEGIVTEYRFLNPHVLVYLDVKNPDGTKTNWMSEGAAANLMRRTGWSRDTFKVGDLIRVEGNATKDGSPMVSIHSVEILDPTTHKVARELATGPGGYGKPPPAAGTDAEPTTAVATLPLMLPDGRPNLTGAWIQNFAAHAGPPGSDDAKIPFNAAGTAAQAAFDITNDPQVFCDPPGLVRQAGFTPHPVRITQYADRVMLEYEEYGGKRVVYLSDKLPPPGVKTALGDSVAQYKDGALVITTVNLLGNTTSPFGNALSDQTTTVEVLKRADDPKYGPILSMAMTVTDPGHLSAPWTITRKKVYQAGYQFIANDCRPPLRQRKTVSQAASFFLTGHGPGDGANLSGLDGADHYCETLAASMGARGKTWRAYLSTQGKGGVNARDRIGTGPWYNVKGVLIAKNVADLHSDNNNLTKATVVDEHGQVVNGFGDKPNRHDVLTGSQLDGTAPGGDSDVSCKNWTSDSEGSALVGHFDRQGGGDHPTSWNSAHASKGCSQADLQSTGGDGLFYCFAAH